MHWNGTCSAFCFNWKLLCANYKHQGKIHQAVNKCYPVSISFLPCGETQLLPGSFMVFAMMLFLEIWKAGVQWRLLQLLVLPGRGKVVVLVLWAVLLWGKSLELLSRGLCLSVFTRGSPISASCLNTQNNCSVVLFSCLCSSTQQEDWSCATPQKQGRQTWAPF